MCGCLSDGHFPLQSAQPAGGHLWTLEPRVGPASDCPPHSRLGSPPLPWPCASLTVATEKGAGRFVSETEGLENASHPGDLPGKGFSTKPWGCLPLTHRHSHVTRGGAELQLGPYLCTADFPICLWRLLDLIPQRYAHLGDPGFRECGELGLTTALKSPSPQLRC